MYDVDVKKVTADIKKRFYPRYMPSYVVGLRHGRPVFMLESSILHSDPVKLGRELRAEGVVSARHTYVRRYRKPCPEPIVSDFWKFISDMLACLSGRYHNV